MAADSCQILRSVSEVREWTRKHHSEGKTVGFVPTMGGIHQGHLSLVTELQKRKIDTVIASIYVNPTQFNQSEDFDTYQRTLDADVAALASVGCAAVFCPERLYSSGDGDGAADGAADDAANVAGADGEHRTPPGGHETWVTVTRLGSGLCARSRPQFFRGVATVVLKLINIVQPDVIALGQKDFQQLRVVQRMVRDLDVPVEVYPCPTVREADGLAMSSRNAKLTPDVRQQALTIYKQLAWAMGAVNSGEVTDAEMIRTTIREAITAAGGVVDYVEVVSPGDLEPVSEVGKVLTVVLVAATFGGVRLIDNQMLLPREEGAAPAVGEAEEGQDAWCSLM
ncbi:unnamed protein product [Pedinophyceae sp. YPF-701]|nr:unnamed protein product [Pedinophyceae sp. YPF-701]